MKFEAYPAFDPDRIDESDFDLDHLQEIAETIADHPPGMPLSISDDASKAFRFDLCPACYAKFVRDPLGREALRRLDYSKN